MRTIKASFLLCALLLALAGCGAQQSGRLDPIAPSAARAIALAAAGLTADQVVFSGTELDDRNGLDYYQVGFTAGGRTYHYDIDAMTGTVIDSQTDGDVPLADVPAPAPAPEDSASPTPTPSNGDGLISEEEAKTIALGHAGLTADGVTFIRSSLDWDDGRRRSDVKFYPINGDTIREYDYEIDAQTGAILDVDYDAEYYDRATPSQSPPVGDGIISQEEAIAIALAHAGLTESQISLVWNSLDWDDGRQVYDVEFYVADGQTIREYDYEIDAYTGGIRDVDHDAEHRAAQYHAREDTTHHPEHSGSTHHTGHNASVTADQAKQLALAQVPGATLDDIREFETDYDDGRVVYEGTIYYGEMEYEFEIDGYSGAIRDWDVESIYD